MVQREISEPLGHGVADEPFLCLIVLVEHLFISGREGSWLQE